MASREFALAKAARKGALRQCYVGGNKGAGRKAKKGKRRVAEGGGEGREESERRYEER